MPQTVLITGASGFLATWVVRDFLAHGYNVVGTVRTQAKADQIKKDLASYGDKLRLLLTPEMGAEGAFDEAVRGVDGVIHTASPLAVSNDITDFEGVLIKPAVTGTTGILESIKKHNPNVKRVVITGSIAAVFGPAPPPSNAYTEADWNPITYESAKAGPAFHAYVGSKAFAEKAAWNYVEKSKPNFSLTFVNPVMIYGPNAQPLNSLRDLNASSRDILEIIDGSSKEVPPTRVPFWVDARDTATAHRLAYEKEVAIGQRYLVSAGSYSMGEVSDILRKNFPELHDKIPARDPSKPDDRAPFTVDTSKIQTELGLTYRSLEESLIDSVKGLVKLQERE